MINYGIFMEYAYFTEYYLNENEKTTAIFKSTYIMLSERGIN